MAWGLWCQPGHSWEAGGDRSCTSLCLTSGRLGFTGGVGSRNGGSQEGWEVRTGFTGGVGSQDGVHGRGGKQGRGFTGEGPPMVAAGRRG